MFPKCPIVVVLSDAVIEEETSLGCVSLEFRPIKKTQRTKTVATKMSNF